MAETTNIKIAGSSARRSLSLSVQGQRLDLLYDDNVRPTLFSLFLANTMRVDESARLAYDLGTGGGILAIALARMGVPRVVAVDRALVACEMAEANVRANGVGSQVEIVHGDIRDLELEGNSDLVIANAPTMPQRPDVPQFAWGGGQDGKAFLQAFLDGLPRWLSGSGQAQVILSSIVEPVKAFEDALGSRFRASDEATIVAPFRSFYSYAYPDEELEEFVANGQALRWDGAHATLSELVTVYMLERSKP